MSPRHLFVPLALVAALVVPAARAATTALPGDGAWASFAVDSLLAASSAPLGWIDDAGDPLAFTFTIGAGQMGMLTVVDAGFAGDTFALTNFGVALGDTSAVPVGAYETATDVGTNYAAAFADPRFSRGVFTLDSGNYEISGRLLQSVTLGGLPLEATAGAVRLATIAAPVPEPSSYALLLAGIGVVAGVARRNARRR